MMVSREDSFFLCFVSKDFFVLRFQVHLSSVMVFFFTLGVELL